MKQYQKDRLLGQFARILGLIAFHTATFSLQVPNGLSKAVYVRFIQRSVTAIVDFIWDDSNSLILKPLSFVIVLFQLYVVYVTGFYNNAYVRMADFAEIIGCLLTGKIDNKVWYFVFFCYSIGIVYYEAQNDFETINLLFYSENWFSNLKMLSMNIIIRISIEVLNQHSAKLEVLPKLMSILILYYQMPLYQVTYCDCVTLYPLVKAILYPFMKEKIE